MKWYKTLAVTFFAACLGGTAQAGRDSSTIEQTLNALSQQITALQQDNQALQTQINQLQPSPPQRSRPRGRFIRQSQWRI